MYITGSLVRASTQIHSMSTNTRTRKRYNSTKNTLDDFVQIFEVENGSEVRKTAQVVLLDLVLPRPNVPHSPYAEQQTDCIRCWCHGAHICVVSDYHAVRLVETVTHTRKEEVLSRI